MKIKIYRTSKNNELFKSLSPLDKPFDNALEIKINPEVTYQTLLGFGGALTPASQEVLQKMPQERMMATLKSIYSKEGLNYSLIRLSIHSCDFSSEVYDYLGGTTSLANFSIERENRLFSLIKLIKEIHEGELTFLASPWSAPAYMKSNNNMLQGGKLLARYYKDWATYFTLYIKEMKKHDVDIKYVSIQNEPEAKQTWESMLYTKEEEYHFCYSYLVPALEKEHLSTEVIVWDHNKDHVYERAEQMFSKSHPQVTGIGYHWYCSEEFENLDKVHDKFPNKHIFFTEGCVELVNKCLHGELFDFKNGEVYGRNYIKGLIHHTEAYFDWNILLDEQGGPNHVGNYCEAPIMYDTNKDELIYNYSYYFIKHMSHFLDKDDVRIATSEDNKLNVVAFKKANESKYILLIQNDSDMDTTRNISLKDYQLGVEIPSHSIQTIIFED